MDISNDKNPKIVLDRACELLKVCINENNEMREQTYGLECLSDEAQNRIKELKRENKQLIERANAMNDNLGQNTSNLNDIFKSYSKSLTEQRKKELREKYLKRLE